VEERAGTVIAQRAPAGNAGRPGTVHELSAGETLWSIAQRYGVTVDDIKRWNNIKDTTRLPTGMRLTVKAP
jgi:membrane-bound lytic murein transglycosylase D